jgi:vacuolar-type H+-ATPase subunit I/STV1
LKFNIFGKKERVEMTKDEAKRKLSMLRFQKEIVSDALLRVYSMQDLDPDVKNKLIEKYKEELKSVNKEIYRISTLIEVMELQLLRDQLLNIINEKISEIDRRLNELKKEMEKNQVEIKESKEEEKNEENDELDLLYEQVNSILEKLEKIDA